MSTLSIPLTPDLEEFVEQEVRLGNADNKAAVVRLALRRMRADEALARVLRSEAEAREGKVYEWNTEAFLRRLKKKAKK